MRYAPPDRNRFFDAVIVGGGITGLTTAYLLKKAGARVAVLEQYWIGFGESGNTTAHLTEVIDQRYQTLQSDFGKSNAFLVAQSNRNAIQLIEDQARMIQEKFDIDCDFHRVPGFLYTEGSDSVRELKKEVAAMKRAGIAASWTENVPLPFKTTGGIEVPDQGRFHPGKYLQGLAREIQGDGSMIFESTRATQMNDGEPCTTVTENGFRLTSKKLVIATHSPSFNRFFLQTKVAAYRTYVVAAHLRTALPTDALYWDSADPYHYSRIELNLWVVGGEDHKTGHQQDTAESYSGLKTYVRDRYSVESMSYRWSGQILNSIDGLPYMGVNPASQHLYIATGFGGNGMTFGTISGMLITDLISGNKNPWADLYAPNRIKPLAAGKDFVVENVDFPLCLIQDRFSASEVSSISKIKPGDGKRVRVKGTVYAVYKDLEGKAHPVTATCPHLGCLVHFNPAEKSWDCPCHGSRFSTDGSLLNGPSTTDLKPASAEILGHLHEPKPKKIAS